MVLKRACDRPRVVNLVDLDGQIAAKRANFVKLEDRAGFILQIMPTLRQELGKTVNDAKGKLNVATTMRRNLEHTHVCYYLKYV